MSSPDRDSRDNELCSQYRVMLDSMNRPDCDLNEGTIAQLNLHLADCTHCLQWRDQMISIEKNVSVLPQFDVPESLTQTILNSVQKERRPSWSILDVTSLPVSIVAVGALMLFMPIDSVDGCISWVIGLASLSAIAFLKKGAVDARRLQIDS